MGMTGVDKQGISVKKRFATVAACVLVLASAANVCGQETPPASGTPKAISAIGTIKAISAGTLVLATDTGAEVKILGLDASRVLSLPPGSKDLKEATPMASGDLQPGDRVLVRGRPGEDAASIQALTIVAMKKGDIAEKRAHEREEWQKHGIGGLVKSVDATQGVVTIGTMTAAGSKDIAIQVGKGTVLRRYTPDSVKFDDAKVAPITEIQPGDQLRARGTRSQDGSEFRAEEVVSGTFRNIEGTISALNAPAGTLSIADPVLKKTVELKVTADSQMRKLPLPMAQRVAMRLKGVGAEPTSGTGTTAPGGGPPIQARAAVGGPGVEGTAGGSGGGTGGPSRNGGDLQQMLSRLPVSALSDFQKGDAVMIVASGTKEGPATVITLLGGVEPILQASVPGQASSILTPWGLGSGGGAEAGVP